MSIEIAFPLEFVVEGTALSLQAERRAAIDEWQGRIRAASQARLPETHFATEGPIAVTLFYFPAAPMGDVDNIIKHILPWSTTSTWMTSKFSACLLKNLNRGTSSSSALQAPYSWMP